MVSVDTVRQLALSFDEAVELPHFDRASFRIKKKSLPLFLNRTTSLY